MFVAVLILMLAYFSVKAGSGGKVFLAFNFILAWVVGPLVGGAVATYASITKFKDVDSKTIFVGFNSVWASVLTISLIFSLKSMMIQGQFGELILFFCQSFACFVGARWGRDLAVSGASVSKP